MIPDNEFEGYVSAHLHYAQTQESTVARSILMRHLENGSWIDTPDMWLICADRLSHRKDAPWTQEEYVDLWYRHIIGDQLTDAVRTQLSQGTSAYYFWSSLGEKRIIEIVNWFVQRAKPGDAGLCAQMLEHAKTYRMSDKSAQRDYFPDAAFPLVEWLLHNGAAELRMAERKSLLPTLVRTVNHHARHDLLELSLRYMVAAGQVAAGWNWPHADLGLWPEFEAALQNRASADLATDAILGLLPHMSNAEGRLWRPLLEPETFPHCRTALLRGLCRGEFPVDATKQGWMCAVFRVPPQDRLSFESLVALEHAEESLMLMIASPALARCEGSINPEQGKPTSGQPRHCETCGVALSRWAEHIIREFLRMYEAEKSLAAPPSVWNRIMALFSWLDTTVPTSPISQVLADLVQNADESRSVTLARKILLDGPASGVRTLSALLCLPMSMLTDVVSPVPSLVSLGEEFTRIVNLPWHGRAGGVPLEAVLGRTKRVEFAILSNDAKVQQSGDTLVLDPGYFHSVLTRHGDTDQARALSTLYFFHELVHLWQGIGDYDRVQKLRSTGAEMTLLHFDLAADHAAAIMTVKAVPRWNMLWLKKLVIGSLEAFPTGAFHTKAARMRKAFRVVSLILDLIARRDGLIPLADADGGYVFGDFGPAGGHLMVLASGPPFQLLKTATLTEADAKVLIGAADKSPESPYSWFKVMETLERCIARSSSGPVGPV